MKKFKISGKEKKEPSPKRNTKQFRFPFINKLRGKKELPRPQAGGDGGGGDGGISRRDVQEDHPGRNFASTGGGFMSSAFNHYIPTQGRPIPRQVGGPPVQDYPQESESESNDDEISNYFRGRQASSFTSGFGTTPSQSKQSIRSKNQSSLPQLKIQEKDKTPPVSIKGSSPAPSVVSQQPPPEVTPPPSPPPLSYRSTKKSTATPQKAHSDSIVIKNSARFRFTQSPADSSSEPPLPYYYSPDEASPSSSSARPPHPTSTRQESLPSSQPMRSFGLSAASVPSMVNDKRSSQPMGSETTRWSYKSPPITFTYSPPAQPSSGFKQPSQQAEEKMSTPLRAPSFPTRVSQHEREPSRKMGSINRPQSPAESISDGSSVEEVLRPRHSSRHADENSPRLRSSCLNFPPRPCGCPSSKEGSESIDREETPPCEPAHVCKDAFTSPIARKSIRARYLEVQPRYTEEPLFWVQPKCDECMVGPRGKPMRQWPPDSQRCPPQDFLLKNAIKVFREPKRTPVPKYLDSSSGRVSDWAKSGLARNYVYKPDFGKVPAYLSPNRRPMCPLDEDEFESIMNFEHFY